MVIFRFVMFYHHAVKQYLVDDQLDTKPHPLFFSQNNSQLRNSCFISVAWDIEKTPSPLASN